MPVSLKPSTVRVYSYAQCVGAVLRYFREAHGLTSVELAQQMGVTGPNMAQVERAWVRVRSTGAKEYTPSLDWLVKWSANVKVPLGHVFTLADRVRFNMGHGTHCLDSGWGTGNRETIRCTAEDLVDVARRLNDGTISP